MELQVDVTAFQQPHFGWDGAVDVGKPEIDLRPDPFMGSSMQTDEKQSIFQGILQEFPN